MMINALIQYVCRGGQDRHGAADTRPQNNIDLPRFCGRWYELARYDTFFQRGLEDVYAEYTLKHSGRLCICNYGTNAKGHLRKAKGGAYTPHREQPGLLRVSFVPPYRWFYTDYRILFVDRDYRMALVSGKDSRNLWLMARSPVVPAEYFFTLLREAEGRGFRTSQLHFTRHRTQAGLPA